MLTRQCWCCISAWMACVSTHPKGATKQTIRNQIWNKFCCSLMPKCGASSGPQIAKFKILWKWLTRLVPINLLMRPSVQCWLLLPVAAKTCYAPVGDQECAERRRSRHCSSCAIDEGFKRGCGIEMQCCCFLVPLSPVERAKIHVLEQNPAKWFRKKLRLVEKKVASGAVKLRLVSTAFAPPRFIYS